MSLCRNTTISNTFIIMLLALVRKTSAFTTAFRSTRHATIDIHTTAFSSLCISTRKFASSSSSSSDNKVSSVAKPKVIQKRRILSGVQPTGTIHLGNYLGAIRQWVDLQNNFGSDLNRDEVEVETESLFCVVDLHAITQPQDPVELQESTFMSAAIYLAAGIDPSKSKVFVQSHVAAHSELGWLLTCITPMNWLERMIQYKDKASKSNGVGVGLFTYPVLMAADIVLYGATHVPVGEDQRQHLELCRDLVRRFNDNYCKGNAYKKRCKKAGMPTYPVFREPEAMIQKIEGTARVMSLTDGTNKMSKSDSNDNSRINVLDDPKVIRDKIKRAKTDAFVGLEWDNPERPEATNLLNIYLAVQPREDGSSAGEGMTKEQIADQVKDMTWGEFKPVLAEAVVKHLEPIQKEYHRIRGDEDYLNNVLKEGADAANIIAKEKLKAARFAMGFAPPAQ